MKINKIFFALFYVLLLLLIFPSVFSLQPISGGDYISFWPTDIVFWRNFSFFLWDPKINLGWSIIPLLSYAPYSSLFGLAGILVGNNIIILERIFWWLPFFTLGFWSSLLLIKKLFPNTKYFSFFAPIVFSFNTYILLLISGGQIAGVGQAYAFSPLLLLAFIHLFEKKSLKFSLIAGGALSLELMFDLRITYVILIAIILYGLFQFLYQWKLSQFSKWSFRSTKKFILLVCIIPGLVTVLLHAYWLIPLAIVRQNPLQELGTAYSTSSAVQFFSFATFENALGLLHPNWPENLFGLIHFMRPEFLFLPILAFSSLLFSKPFGLLHSLREKQEQQHILFFLLIGLIGIFLAKGANEPFGQIYLWLFTHVPGFMMFRDPSKWYTLIALSYSMLIPYTLWKISEKVSSIKYLVLSKYGRFIVGLVFIIFWLFTIHQALFRQISGTLQVHSFPQDYKTLQKFLESQNNYSRTFWIPSVERYGYYSINHPAIAAYDFFHVGSISGVLEKMKENSTQEILQESSVKYIIVPYDAQKELFIKDRKYDDSQSRMAITYLQTIPWLHQLSGFGKIAVFEQSAYKDHFWVQTTNGSKKDVVYSFITPTAYKVNLHNIQVGDTLVFSEAYNNYWTARIGENHQINSKPYHKQFNSFQLNKSGSFSLEIDYLPQRYVDIGMIVSICSFLGFVGILIFVIR